MRNFIHNTNWRRVLNPIEGFAWVYGKWFINYPILGYAVVCSIGALIMAILWTWGIDKYNEKLLNTPEKQPAAIKSQDNDLKKPTMIKIKNSKNIKVEGNIGVGDMKLLDAEKVENLDAKNNILINPKDTDRK